MLHVKGAETSGVVSLELYGKIFRACPNCGEPNPAPVACPDCGTVNRINENCRNCGGPGGIPRDAWSVCPSCGTKAVVEDLGLMTAWYRNPFKRMLQHWRERRAKRRKSK